MRNDTAADRLIRLCDVERPVNLPGRTFNRLYSTIAGGMLVPNLPEDRRGPVSAMFSALAPLQEPAQRLRARRRWLYNICKLSLNITLLVVLTLFLLAVLLALEAALETVSVE